MNRIKILLGLVCVAASAGAQNAMKEFNGLAEILALLLKNIQDSGALARTSGSAAADAVAASTAAPAAIAASEAAVSGWYARLGAFADTLFTPVFQPMNQLLAHIYEPWAQIVVVVYFVGTWVWVAFVLKKEYVNLSCPYKTRLADLRFWTLVAMLPTLTVYLYFQ